MAKRNIAAYSVEEEILTQALESEAGVKLRPKACEATKQWATFQRHRLNQCREASRQQSAEMRPAEDPLYGKSPYEGLVLRVKKDVAGYYVEIAPAAATLADLFIEPIPPSTEDSE